MASQLRAIVTGSVALVALGAGALALAGPALADPPVGVYRPVVGVGSDTIQSVENALAGDVSGVTGVVTNVASYDAFPQNSNIQTTAGGPSFLRPTGSGAGVKALSDALTGTLYNGVNLTGQVSYARSSAGPSVTGSDLTFIPFGRDAVSYAYQGAATRLGKLTTQQLHDLYSSNTPTTINGVVVKPLLPQTASGTRKFFLSAIGVTTLGSQVVETNLPENDGTVLTAVNQVIPFSAAQWIGQVNGLVANTTAGDHLGSPNGVLPIKKNTQTGLFVPNTTFYNGSYGRDVYNVIPTSATGTGALKTLFVGVHGKFCTVNAQAVVKQFGFNGIGNRCGSTTLTGGLTPDRSVTPAPPGPVVATSTPRHDVEATTTGPPHDPSHADHGDARHARCPMAEPVGATS